MECHLRGEVPRTCFAGHNRQNSGSTRPYGHGVWHWPRNHLRGTAGSGSLPPCRSGGGSAQAKERGPLQQRFHYQSATCYSAAFGATALALASPWHRCREQIVRAVAAAGQNTIHNSARPTRGYKTRRPGAIAMDSQVSAGQRGPGGLVTLVPLAKRPCAVKCRGAAREVEVDLNFKEHTCREV